MAQTVAIRAEERAKGRKSDLQEVRREGKIPAILYGKGLEPRTLKLPAKEMDAVIRHHGHGAILELNIDGGERLTALIKELERHKISGHLQHLGLQNILMSDTIHTTVPIVLTGAATAVEDASGMMEQTMTELSVTGRADRVPESLTLDISGLTMGATLRVGDLTLPEGITTTTDVDQVIVTTSVSAAARQEAAEAAEAAATPEAAEEGETAEA